MNARIAAVTLEQLLTEGKEIRMGKAVILQDDRLGHGLEHPVQTAGDSSATAEVDVRIVGKNLARPIHPTYHRTGLRDQALVLRVVRPGTVGHYQQPTRLRSRDRGKHPVGEPGSIEDQKGD